MIAHRIEFGKDGVDLGLFGRVRDRIALVVVIKVVG